MRSDMTKSRLIDFAAIRGAMANFELSPKVTPNETIALDRAFFPDGHRGVLDLRRQLVVGNRGMGKSFWTHALVNLQLRERLTRNYGLPALATAVVKIGFNGSDRLGEAAPTPDEIAQALQNGHTPDRIWQAVFVSAARLSQASGTTRSITETINELALSPQIYSQILTDADDRLAASGKTLLVVFDALERLARDWSGIRDLTKGLLIRTLGLQSFRAIHAKIFMRIDQFADDALFQFPDSSKVKNDRVDLTWHADELYGLLLHELLRCPGAHSPLIALALKAKARRALPHDGRLNADAPQELADLINAIAGEFMGSDKKRGRVYTWVPLHLSDAANNCSPRTFLTAWKSAADHTPSPKDRIVDHLGLIDGVRHASSTRLAELREDYPWIDSALEPLRRQLVPIARSDLFGLWKGANVVAQILNDAKRNDWLAPIDLFLKADLEALLNAMVRIAVMEERANKKINVPDILRVGAEILRKGGVAVPRRK